MAKVLVACEFSGTVRDAFLALGHDAWSCDVLPSETPSNRHIQCDVREILDDGWDCLIVAHPPCTRLCNSGVRWLTKPPKNRQPGYPDDYETWTETDQLAFMWSELDKGAELFSKLWNADIPHVAVENPVMHPHAKARIINYQPATQTVQPWWFGEPQFKGTGLYLHKLPPLVATDRLTPPKRGTDEHKAWSVVHRMGRSANRSKERSRFFPGIATAMANQWTPVIEAGEQRRAA
ncbi:hypothetical protein SAMN04515647_3691 [Cohaesibacter sp. ES.047]|uniref:hypothetical protein n=1 Tax=Cohaesibacter sp. ES.047 TaxID=1798205 RepID=UPI000BB7DE54|nr:hypothetical protein [Cohaesibacter sp. ES.047]SNY93396.1 hypothetical protein SAMN04515647_3691 [Cohaesibacter sp. ES.047]